MFIIAAGLLSGAGAASVAAYRQAPSGVVPPGVRAAGMELGGKSVVSARHELDTWAAERRDEVVPLTLSRGGSSRTWRPTRAKLGVTVDVDTTLAEAMGVGRRDSAFARLVSWFAGREPVDIAPRWKSDVPTLRRYLAARVAPAARIAERDARLVVAGSTFQRLPERPGQALDVDGATDAVLREARLITPRTVDLPVRAVAPRVTAADLAGIREEVTRFSTHYGERGNRKRNLEVACARINGVVLRPGDVFSYNKTVGPRDADAGFKIAPVIVRGKLEPGMGGGVCQVSTTLYNAALLADLEVVSRSHHAFPVHYVPAGRDATVVYGAIDFRFRNSTDGPIAIGASAEGGRVTMRVFGRRAVGREVSIERTGVSSWGPKVVAVRDSGLRPGARRTREPGRSGHRVTVWRIVRVGGRQVRREMVSRDTYAAATRVVAVGPAAPPRPPATPPATGDAGAGAAVSEPAP